jgi:acetyl-CoA carboxylase biotin carboxyl carrier protein
VATDPKNTAPHPFDVKTVEHLISLMSEHELSEISLADGDQRIRLRKGMSAPTAAFLPGPMPYPLPAPVGNSAPVPSAVSPPAPPARNLLEIKSPMVGTFYSKPSPDKPDFVSVGSKVTATTVVCKLEAMKIFNDLTADLSGTVAEVCVKNAQAVDYGTVLFRVEPS